MMVMGDASGIEGYDRRTSELSNAPLHAPLHTKQDDTSMELWPP